MPGIHHQADRASICGQGLYTEEHFQKHVVQSEHHACEDCGERFGSRKKLAAHLKDEHNHCPICNRFFNQPHGLAEHCEEFDGHFYCRQCKRVFGSYNNLKNHLQSSKHVAKDIDCSGCNSSFVSRSALVLHYDVGGCPSDRVNLVIVDMMVRLLSKGSNIIADIPRLRTNVTHPYVPVVAPGETVCPLCCQPFRETRDLMRHLQSPHHDEKVYVCRGTDCGASFSLLSALVQHVDSEKCDASQHEEIVSALEGVLTELEAYLDK